MKALAYIVTAAAVLIGAEVYVTSNAAAQPADAPTIVKGPMALYGGSGIPPPPPDAY